MSKNNGHQLTLPALLNRKRKADDSRVEPLIPSQQKRRHLQPRCESDNIQVKVEPDSPKINTPLDDTCRTLSKFRELTCGPSVLSRPSPIPALPWADPNVLWMSMMAPDVRSKDSRSTKMFELNPEVQPKMRSILLDWLIEVAEVYKLHRETYYLAQDYVDRVLLASKNTPKSELQLLGITCLFIASKVEEIYPPKVTEFAYVTDGACTEKAIVDHEIFVLELLEWDLCPLTPAGWLRMYLQIACQQLDEGKSQHRFDLPRFPIKSLSMVSRLLDLATLDAGCMAFSYSTLAAAAFALIYGRECAVKASGFSWPQLKLCVAWMARYAITLHTEGLVVIAGTEEMNEDADDMPLRPELKFSPTVHADNDHNLQNHVITLKMLEIAYKCVESSFEEDLTDRSSSSSEHSSPNHQKTPSNKVSKHPEDAECLEKAPVKCTTTAKPNVQNLNPKELFQSQE